MASHDVSFPDRFADPPREFGVIPFWFWNDDLEEKELFRQIREFHGAGFGGFIPHARIGLSRRVGYLTPEYFRLLSLCVDEAKRLGMRVVLYDEGSYPSGSAHGAVVAENPAWAARCLIALHRQISGPATGFWRPNPGRAMRDRLVAVVQARETAPESLDPATLTLLTPHDHEVVRYDVPDGNWRLVACWDVFSGGTIRGVFDEEEDGHATAPPAADIMNPEAVACFIRRTHERFYEHLAPHFGSTIPAIFTDEPNPLGRSPQRGPLPKPFTLGLLDDVQTDWDGDVLPWLPALWLDCGRRTAEFRRAYDHAVSARIGRVFYGALSRWCSDHSIALTGHPSASNEMGTLRYFHWPGQDMVWRYVEPNTPKAVEGPNSVAPRSASSAAILQGRRFSTSELLGAYGWRLTLDEAKWLFDWHLARGNNLFYPHACFYSIRGRRAFESEPDLGVHNVWWPHFHVLSDYVRRLSWLLTDGREVCDVAILTQPDDMAWAAAKELLQDHIGFVYVDSQAMTKAWFEQGRLAIGGQRFRAVVCDPPGVSDPAARKMLHAYEAAGGMVVENWTPGELGTVVAGIVGRDTDCPNTPSLRTLHYCKAGRDIHLLVNEGERLLECDLSLRSVGSLELWDPMDGTRRPWPGRTREGRLHTRVRLERRQACVLVVDPSAGLANGGPYPPIPHEAVFGIYGPWTAVDARGNPLDIPCPADWAQIADWETFSGAVHYRTEFDLPPDTARLVAFLDLGRVGDIAEAVLNDQPLGVRLWAPYVFHLGSACRAGSNRLEVRVTNSMANAYDGLQLPSGLLGPVALRAARPSFPSPAQGS